MPLPETYPRGVSFVGGRRRARSGLLSEPQIGGTSFLVHFPDERQPISSYVVTAGHVAMGLEESFVRVLMESGSPVDVSIPEWTHHPMHDVAVAPIRLPPGSALVGTATTQFIDDPSQREAPQDFFNWPFDLAIGDDIYFVGLLGNVRSMTMANIPMVRSGTLGAIWQEGVPVRRYPGADPHEITAHLIDCRAIAGFSGSPCYVQQFTTGFKDGHIGSQYRTALLGLIGGHFDDRARYRATEGQADDGVEVFGGTGVAYVIPAEFIRETLMLDEVAEGSREPTAG